MLISLVMKVIVTVLLLVIVTTVTIVIVIIVIIVIRGRPISVPRLWISEGLTPAES